MSTVKKLSDETQRTIANTDIIPIQGDVSGVWTNFKTSVSKLKDFIYTLIFSDDNTWTGSNDFTGGTTKVANGTATTEAVNYQQLAAKEDSHSYAEFNDTYKSLELLGTSRDDSLGCTGGFMFQGEQYTPTGRADPNGNVGSFCFDDDYLYYKSSAGWGYYSKITLLP